MGNHGMLGFSKGYSGMSIYGTLGSSMPSIFMEFSILSVNASDVLTVLGGGFVDFLLVASGGAVGAYTSGVSYAAGGGGGECLYRRSIYLPEGVYPVSIGLPKAPPGGNNFGANGDDSTFFGLIARGGKGAGNGSVIGQGGNSGNGLFVGGNRSATRSGGGAGDNGNGGSSAGPGGIGSAFDITGVLKYYAGGGGGNAGGAGTPGLGYGPNTGGGGNSNNTSGSASYAGVLILRYLARNMGAK